MSSWLRPHDATKRSIKNKGKGKRPRKASPKGNGAMWSPLYGPVHKFERVIEGAFDIINNGIADSISNINFSLNDLPSFAEFTALYDMYRIWKVDIEFTPEYTELTDASLVSTAQNMYFNSVIDQAGIGITLLSDALQYQSLVSTPITKMHKRTLTPSVLMGGLTPCSCWLSTASPSTNHYGLDVAVQACGTAMTFRSRVKFYLEFNQSR